MQARMRTERPNDSQWLPPKTMAQSVILGALAAGAIFIPAVATASCPSSPGAYQAIVYEDANRSGNCAVLDVGSYSAPPFGSGSNLVANDRISSISLGSAVMVDLYQHSQFGGQVYHYENGPFWFNVGGWANDDVSSIIVSRRTMPSNPEATHSTFSFSVGQTDTATNSATKVINLGTVGAGKTLRIGTCTANGDLPYASASGDTYVRVLVNGTELATDDDGCGSSYASYLSYTMPLSASVTVKVGCYSANSCSGMLDVATAITADSNGSLADVTASFNAMVGNSPNRNKLNFWQNGLVVGAYQYHVSHVPHFQGIQRVPRTLLSTSDAAPKFVLSGSDNADLYTINFDASTTNVNGLVGALPGSPVSASRVVGVESVASYLDGDGRGHLGGLQASGRWLAGGVERGGGPGPSTVQFWDLNKLPNPSLIRVLDNPNGSAGAIALTKRSGKNRGFLMFVAGQSETVAQVWALTGSYGYADLATGEWKYYGQVTTPSGVSGSTKYGFQSLNFVSQNDGSLYLVGTVGNGTTNPEEGADTAYLMKVEGDIVAGTETNNFQVSLVTSKVFVCGFDSSRQCGFNAAASIFVDPDQNALRLYASKAYRPDNSGSPMTFVEYY